MTPGRKPRRSGGGGGANPLNQKVRAVVRREYMQRVRSKWFLLSTLGLPLLFIGLGVLSGFLISSSREADESVTVGVIDRSASLGGLVVSELLQDSILAAAATDLAGATESEIRARLADSGFDLMLLLPSDLADEIEARSGDRAGGGPQAMLLARDNVSGGTRRAIEGALDRALVRWRLREAGIEGLDPAALLRGARLGIVNVTEEGGARSQEAFQAISFVIAFFFYMVLIVYGQMIIRSILEEKTSDIVEVMVSSLRPWELMLGKIVGVGAVGLTQLAIWGVVIGASFVLGLAGASALAEAGIDLRAIQIPWGTVATILAFLVLGYLLYAGLFAGGGATISTEQDAQQVAIPIIMLIVVPFIAVQGVIESPSAGWAVIMSLVPFFSPLIMPSRMLVTPVPAWQVAAALLLLLFCILGAAWVAGRIYRVGILMKGQRANLPEIVRWVRHG